jgi:hypothetical protein
LALASKEEVMRRGIIVALGTAAIFIVPSAGTAWADFVCPVLPVSDQAKQHSKPELFITISDGDTSILPGKAGNPASSPVDVPAGATNQNSDGTPGSPDGDHASPGDPGYSAIWNT